MLLKQEKSIIKYILKIYLNNMNKNIVNNHGDICLIPIKIIKPPKIAKKSKKCKKRS